MSRCTSPISGVPCAGSCPTKILMGAGGDVPFLRRPSLRGTGVSTASQTAWALMGLLAAGEARTKVVQRGIQYLLRTQTAAGSWYEPEFTGTGFPKYFFIKYHMYQHYFPLMALARYRQSLLDL